ncbi:MAG: MBL fold metallo-hydrolase [Methanoregula sp.]|jgi:glyoxylase-like metal-dependent hydrolase (beta-lactamase superfamily II)/ACT domain-containing protein|uniref:MBL fold metallo-hydrolase n=1 Tax=Methanoregula sp. TaxID=2052170 RepID=UPI003D1198C3
MEKFSFIAHMPDEPGSLHRAAEIIKKYDGNINRIQFDRRIDPGTVFYEVTADAESYSRITRDLADIGYLQTSLKPLDFLKFCVYLPHQPGALYEFLSYTTSAGANIAGIDFDDRGQYPDRLTVSLNLEQSAVVNKLLDQLKSRYRLEIIEYDKTGKHLDDTVFYVRYAQEVRDLIGESEEAFILSFLADTNHIAQDLMARGCDPRQVFESVLATGRTMNATTGNGFYADVQQFCITDKTTLFCFQVPCGGSIFLIRTPDEMVMIDTGYGIYHNDILAMLSRYDVGEMKKLSRIVVTHADADHYGASGYFSVPVLMHEDTLEITRRNNRAYGSRSEDSVLEAFYTRMINQFSRFRTPPAITCFSRPSGTTRGIFPVIGTIHIGDLDLEVLDGLGGHTCGQVFLYSRLYGLLFAADSVINFGSLTKERADYSSLAAFLVTSVNVDSERAKQERKALLGLALETDQELAKSGRRCLICGGHGAVSVLENGKLVAYGKIERYEAGNPA